MSQMTNAPPSAQPPPLWLRAAPVVFLLLWSAGFPVGRIGISYAGPMTFLSIRYLFVVAIMGVMMIILRPALPQGAEWKHLVVVGMLVQGLYFGLGYGALALGVSAGVAALIASLQPILTAVLAPRLAGEPVAPATWVGLTLGLAGAILVIITKSGIGQVTRLGLVAAVGSLCAMTAGTFYEKRYGVSHHPVPAALVQNGVALIGLLPIAIFAEHFAVTPSLPLAASLAYLIIGNSVIAIGLLLAMVRRGQVSRVSTLFFLVPPLAAFLSWLLLGEQVPPLAWVGFGLAAVGVGITTGVFRGRRPGMA